ncbi:hypothetical protein ACROYT_G039078 [Oculina patagonica]
MFVDQTDPVVAVTEGLLQISTILNFRHNKLKHFAQGYECMHHCIHVFKLTLCQLYLGFQNLNNFEKLVGYGEINRQRKRDLGGHMSSVHNL